MPIAYALMTPDRHLLALSPEPMDAPAGVAADCVALVPAGLPAPAAPELTDADIRRLWSECNHSAPMGLARAVEAHLRKLSCYWSFDHDGYWFSACGARWTFREAGPTGNGLARCPRCGRPVQEDGP